MLHKGLLLQMFTVTGQTRYLSSDSALNKQEE